MLEVRINKTGDGYSFSCLRENGVNFYLQRIPDELTETIKDLLVFANSLKTSQEKATESVIGKLSVEDQTIELFPEWKPYMQAETGKKYQHEGILYEAISEHITQDDWRPADVPALFNRISPVEGADEPQEWVKPAGAHDAYGIGDVIIFNDKLYKSVIETNVWSPDEYPTGWEEQYES